MIKKIFLITIITLGIALNWSCQKSQSDKDREAITKYISDNNIDAVEYETSGLFYSIKKAGGAAHPSSNSEVTVNYDGHLLNGERFDKGDTIKLYLDQTIYGWKLGIPLIGEGGSIQLLVPSSLAYGTRKVGDIPANSPLVFDVDLILFN